MSPDPYVRGQLAVLVGLLVLIVAVDSWLAAAIVAGSTALAVVLLERRYRSDLSAHDDSSIPAPRRKLDRMVVRDAGLALVVIVVAIGLEAGLSPDLVGGLAGVRPAIIALAAAAATIYVSSLVDWFVILPRIGGQLGPRPCRDREPEFKRFPATWREVTRWWVIHRCCTTVAFRVALSLALANIIGEVADLGLSGKVLIAGVTGIFSVYFAALPWAALETMRTRAAVGQTIRVGEIRAPKWTMPWRSSALPRFKGRYYVVDVDIASVQLIKVGKYERAESGQLGFARHPVSLPVKNLAAISPADQPTPACRDACGRINWYCVENPACYEPK